MLVISAVTVKNNILDDENGSLVQNSTKEVTETSRFFGHKIAVFKEMAP